MYAKLAMTMVPKLLGFVAKKSEENPGTSTIIAAVVAALGYDNGAVAAVIHKFADMIG